MQSESERRGVMQIRPEVEFAHRTDVGCQREQNEDSFGYWEPVAGDVGRKGPLAVVADGMGGYEGGQEASQLAVKTVSEVYRNADGSDVRSTLMEGLKTAHARIQEYAHEHPELAGMGTTCSAAALVGNQLYFAHVGDSRLYLVRGGSMSRLTRDDSYVSRLVESGLIRPEDAEVHPQRHILTAALGVGAEIRPECPDTPIDLEPDDVMVLCTDGLWGLVSDEELRQIVSDRPPAEACSELVELAREHGGPDNITVLVLRVAG